MISLEQIQQLEIRVKRAVVTIQSLTEEKKTLEKRIVDLESELEAFQREASDHKANEEQLEVSIQGVLDILDEIDQDTQDADLEKAPLYDFVETNFEAPDEPEPVETNTETPDELAEEESSIEETVVTEESNEDDSSQKTVGPVVIDENDETIMQDDSNDSPSDDGNQSDEDAFPGLEIF